MKPLFWHPAPEKKTEDWLDSDCYEYSKSSLVAWSYFLAVVSQEEQLTYGDHLLPDHSPL